MARTRRDLETSTVLHVGNRGNDRQDIFSLDADWHLFESDLAERCELHGVAVLAYAWMDNHFHLVVECDDVGRLPAMMREVQSSYARSYNLRTGRTGSLFERAFFSRPIGDDADLLQTARYVHLNPVDIVGEAALPAYRWSSLGVYLGRRPAPTWMRTDRLSGLIDPARHLSELRRPHRWDRLPLGACAPRRRASLPEVVEAVDSIDRRVDRGVRDELLCHLALWTRAATDVEVGDLLGVVPSTVRRRARRIRVRAETEPEISILCDVLIDALAADPPALGRAG